MDVGGAIVGALGGGGAVAVVGFVRELWRGRRSAQVQHARVEVAQIDAEQVTLGLLADRVRSLETAQSAERAKCDEQIAEVRAEAAEQHRISRGEVHALRAAHTKCELRLSAMGRELAVLLDQRRHEDDTARLGPKGEKR